MVMMLKLKYVDELSGGRKRFRRRHPKTVAGVPGEEFFQVSMKSRAGAAIVVEWENLLAEFEKVVANQIIVALDIEAVAEALLFASRPAPIRPRSAKYW